MNRVFSAASEVNSFCERQGWEFCFIGGVAVQRWGEQRATNDVDLSLLSGWGNEEMIADAVFSAFRMREGFRRAELIVRRVLFFTASNGVGVDLSLGAIPFEVDCIRRSTAWLLTSGGALRTRSAEDLLVHKCFANRDRDWTDVEGILIRRWGKLDLHLVRRELRPLIELKEAPDILSRLDKLLKRLSQSKALPKWEAA